MEQLKKLAKEECELEMTPMIDVTFLLLIFFMCTLKFKTLEGKLAAYLPKDVGVNTSEAEPKEKVEILLRVRREGDKLNAKGEKYEGSGRWVYDETRIIEYSVGPKKTPDIEELGRRLKELHKKDPEQASTIDARTGIVYGDVVKVLDIALSAGYNEITFVGAYPEGTK
jgi:biopolymer transport protein ExbD